MHFVSGFLQAICIIAAIALIVLVGAQTTKSEGLTGTIGGKMSSSFSRGKLGKEDQLAEWTKWAAVAFMVTAFLSYLVHAKFSV